MSVSVSMSVCPFACMSQELHVQTPLNFLFMLLVAVAQSSTGSVAIHPVFWMMLCLHIIGNAKISRGKVWYV